MTDQSLARRNVRTNSHDDFSRAIQDRYRDALRRFPALEELPTSDHEDYVQLLCMQADGLLDRLREAAPGLVDEL